MTFRVSLQWRPISNTSLDDYTKPQLTAEAGPVSLRSETIPMCDHRPWREVVGWGWGGRGDRRVMGWGKGRDEKR